MRLDRKDDTMNAKVHGKQLEIKLDWKLLFVITNNNKNGVRSEYFVVQVRLVMLLMHG